MANLSRSRFAYLSLNLLCLSRIDQVHRARILFFCILRMRKIKSVSRDSLMSYFDTYLNVFKRLHNGDFPDFNSFVFSFKDVISEMKSFEQAGIIAELRLYYRNFRNVNKLLLK